MATKSCEELEQRIEELEHESLERQQEEEKHEISYQTAKNIIQKAIFGIYLVNEEGYIDYVNPAMIQIAGVYFEEFNNMNVFNLPTYQKIGLSQKIKSGLDGEYFKMDAVKYTSYYGNKTTIRNFTGIPLKEEGKRKLLMIVEDVTVSKQVEEELDKHRQHLQNLVEELVKEHNTILVESNEQLREEITEHKQAEQKIKFSSEKLRDLFSLLQSVKNGKRSHITHEIHDTLEQLITAVQIELSD